MFPKLRWSKAQRPGLGEEPWAFGPLQDLPPLNSWHEGTSAARAIEAADLEVAAKRCDRSHECFAYDRAKIFEVIKPSKSHHHRAKPLNFSKSTRLDLSVSRPKMKSPSVTEAMSRSDGFWTVWDSSRVIVRGDELGELEERRAEEIELARYRREKACEVGKFSRRRAREMNRRMLERERLSHIEDLSTFSNVQAGFLSESSSSSTFKPNATFHGFPSSDSCEELQPSRPAHAVTTMQAEAPNEGRPARKDVEKNVPGMARLGERRSRVLDYLSPKQDRKSRMEMLNRLSRTLRKRSKSQDPDSDASPPPKAPVKEPVREPSPPAKKITKAVTKSFETMKMDEVSDAMLAKTFFKLRQDGDLHRDDLQRALEIVGFLKPEVQWINDIYPEVSNYAGLGLDEFFTFVHKYEARQKRAYQEYFLAADADDSGKVDMTELSALFTDCGIEPMKHVVEEVLEEVDVDGEGSIDLQEFETVMNILRGREGFSRNEYESFMEVYRRFDKDQSGEIDTKELLGILCWLGFTFDQEKTTAIVKEVDFDGSGTINEPEFLACMRKVRERELDMIKKVMAKNDEDGSGTISANEIENVFKMLGYVPDLEAVGEAARDAGLSADHDELDLGEMWRLLGVYRHREGFGLTESTKIKEAFEQFDTQGRGEINTLEIGKVLRVMGCPMGFEALQDLISKVDVDGSGKLDLPELRKLLRMQHEQGMAATRIAFAECDEGDKGYLTTEEARMAMESLGIDGICENKLQIHDFLKLERYDLSAFLQAVTYVKRMTRRTMQDSGFSKEELKQLERCFQHYDVDKSGDVSKGEMVALVEEMFPDMSTNPAKREPLVELFRDIDNDGNGTVSFQDFLRLVRRLSEVQDAERLAKEKKVVEETSFTQEEVREFRELFLASDLDLNGEITIDEAKKMIRTVCPLGDALAAKFTAIFHNATSKSVKEGRDQADFPEFLLLMRKLLDEDFANIKSRTAGNLMKS